MLLETEKHVSLIFLGFSKVFNTVGHEQFIFNFNFYTAKKNLQNNAINQKLLKVYTKTSLKK